ncbi:MAG: hypothetical protein NT079_04130 [Candidatus Omnitrophica bacterium]|nr:hypothetical protein [Candidatus Omnitrophota bacterium]
MMHLKKYQKNRNGQTLLEFIVLFIVLVTAFLAMQKYIQRAAQGKWKESIDGLGKQYDPAGNIIATSNMESNAETIMDVTPALTGYRTGRVDTSNTIENKTEEIKIDGL